MSSITEQVGQLIREARKAKGMTQKELGEKLGLNDSTITSYEKGRNNFTVETLEKIAEAFGGQVEIRTPPSFLLSL